MIKDKHSKRKVNYKEKPRGEIYVGIALQLIAFLIAVGFFLLEFIKAEPQEKFFLWTIFIGLIIGIFLLLAVLSQKERQEKIEWLESEIIKLNEQISFRKVLEDINYKVGELHGKK